MCLSCGDSANYFDNHGDPRRITMTTLQNASASCGLTIAETLANIQRGTQDALRGMTDWTGDQQGGGSGVLGGASATSSAPPAHEQAPYS